MRGRPKIQINKSTLLHAIKNTDSTKETAEFLDVSLPTYYRLCEENQVDYNEVYEESKYGWLYDLLGLDKKGKEKKDDFRIPQLNTMTIEVPEGKNHALLVLLGDVHYGHSDCDKEFFAKVLVWLYENKHVYLITMGDMCEISIKDSPGIFDQESFARTQVAKMVKMLKPIADEGRLIGMHTGNHEKRIFKKTGFDPAEIMAVMLGIPYFGYNVAHRITVKQGNKKEVYKMYTTHGASRAQYTHTKLNASIRMAKIIDDAEVYAMGHVHELGSMKARPYRIGDEGEELTRVDKIFILTGSYLKYWGTYAQDKGYSPPGATGSPKVKLHIDEHRISVSS